MIVSDGSLPFFSRSTTLIPSSSSTVTVERSSIGDSSSSPAGLASVVSAAGVSAAVAGVSAGAGAKSEATSMATSVAGLAVSMVFSMSITPANGSSLFAALDAALPAGGASTGPAAA